jgi:type IV pilus assembly protein PilV
MNGNNLSASVFHQQGVVLLEALIAILIFSFSILGLVGLQGSMVKSTTDAKYRSEASYIAQQTLGRLWADPCNLGAYSLGVEDISDRLPSGTRNVTHWYSGNPPNDTCLPAQLIDQTQVEITWQLPGETEAHRVVNSASITGG